MVLEHREALIYTLGKAAELEHLVMCQYLYAAFSLKQSEKEGISTEQLAAVTGWRKTLLEIAEQEMLHLALVREPAHRRRRGPEARASQLPAAGAQLPGRHPDGPPPVRGDGAAALRLPRAARGARDGRCRGLRGARQGGPAAGGGRGRDRPAPPGLHHHRASLSVDRGWAGAPGAEARNRAALHRSAVRPGDRQGFPLGRARAGDRPRIGSPGAGDDRGAGRGGPWRLARRALRPPRRGARRVPGRPCGGSGLRTGSARAAGSRSGGG